MSGRQGVKKSSVSEHLNPDDWKSGLRFGLKTLNTNSVKRAETPAEVLPICLRHNLRKDNKCHRHRRPIDPLRTSRNSVLRGPDDPTIAAELAFNIFDELGLVPPRHDSIMGIEMVCQPPDGWDLPAFWDTCLSGIDGRYQHIISAVVHRDQVRPHMHVLALPIVDGKLAGAAMTSHDNRFYAQLSDFMAYMRTELGLRPDRKPRSRSMTDIFISSGKGPKTHAAAAKRDTELWRAAGARSSDLIAREPHGPADLIAPTSLLRSASAASALIAEATSSGPFHGAATAEVVGGSHTPASLAAGGNFPAEPSASASFPQPDFALLQLDNRVLPTCQGTLAVAAPLGARQRVTEPRPEPAGTPPAEWYSRPTTPPCGRRPKRVRAHPPKATTLRCNEKRPRRWKSTEQQPT